MKKSKIILCICGIAAGFAAVFAGVWMISYAGNRTMDRSEALGVALEDAALEESEITITRENMEYNEERKYYEIDFYSASYAYEYEIDAIDGEILGVSIEALFDGPEDRPMLSEDMRSLPAAQPSMEILSDSETPSAPDTPPEQDGQISTDAAAGEVTDRETDDYSYNDYCGYREHHGYYHDNHHGYCHSHNCWYE